MGKPAPPVLAVAGPIRHPLDGRKRFSAAANRDLPTAIYGCVLLLSAIAFSILVRAILACQPRDSILAGAIGDDLKGRLSLGLYAAAIPLTFLNRWIAVTLYALVALMWLVPDRRIESRLRAAPPHPAARE